MYRTYRQILFERFRAVLLEKFQVEIPRLTVEEPPRVEMGDYALPIAFELARTLRKAPRKIAEELVAAIGSVPGFTGFEVAGAGYINCRLDRNLAAHALAAQMESLPPTLEFILVEHTSINPNKAAHVGHLRNSILGDTLVRMLRAANYQVGVQNYIDNTGVQVADVVVALMHLRGMDLAGVERWIGSLPPAASASTSPAGISTPMFRNGTTPKRARSKPANKFVSIPCTRWKPVATRPPPLPTWSRRQFCAVISKP